MGQDPSFLCTREPALARGLGTHHSQRTTGTYRADWEPAATSGRRVLGVFWRCPAVLWGPSTPNPTQVSWKTLILKIGRFFLRHVDMWWFCPMWPKYAFGDQKSLIRKKDMPFGNPPHHGTKNCGILKNIDFFLFFGLSGVKKWYFGSKKRWF